jgi:hypothetical protein
MRRLALAVLAMLLLASSARAQPAPAPHGPYYYRPPPPRPFDRGAMNAGFAFGLGSGVGGTTIGLAGHFGYFVLPGLEPGLDTGVTFGSGTPTVGSLMPYVRWVIWRSWTVSPYLKVQGGRWFVSDYPDVSPVGGGGGLVFFLSRMLAVQLEGMVYRLFPSSACGGVGTAFDSCTVPTFGVSLGFFFGGRRPAPPPPPPPPPPPQAAPAAAPAAPALAPRHEAAPPQSRGVTDEPGVR